MKMCSWRCLRMSGWPSGLRREVQATKSQSKRQDVSSRKHASILMGSARVGSNPTPDIFFFTLTVGYLAWQNSITKENVNRAETEWRAEKKQQRVTGCSTREWRTCAKGRYIFISSFNRGNMLCFRSLEVMTNAFQALDPSSNLGGCTFFVLSVLLLMLALKHVESRLWPSYFVPWKYVYNVAQFR